MLNTKYIVIDIGTHKLEELKVLFRPGVAELVALLCWALKRVIKAILLLEFASLAPVWETIRMFLRTRNHKAIKGIKFVCVEPNIDICHPDLRDFKKEFDVAYYPIAILGHSHNEDYGLIDLNYYDNTLSSSIYNKTTLGTPRKHACLSFKFSIFLDLLKAHQHISSNDEVILRVNCEGAELGIVRAIRESGIKVRSIIGSLADVRKIHGENEYQEMLRILSELGIKYYYFVGSNPGTWLEAFKSPDLASIIYKP
jgi:hypothetical protein